jgi:ubiquinone/menaquinone biosynthesis C-methylase UbiE
MTSPEPDARSEQARRVAAVFDQVADTYDNVGVPWFVPIAEHLVSFAAPTTGERALDIGCGRGAALFPLAAAVGPQGQVLGVDVSVGMVDATRRDVVDRGLSQVTVEVADASWLSLAGPPFDLAVASLVLFFLPDPESALVSWRGALVPGGRLVLSTFGARDPVLEAVDDVFTPYLPPQLLDARTAGAKGPFTSDAGMSELLEGAGFVDVEHRAIDVELAFESPERWATWSRSHGQRAMWDAVPQAAMPRLEAAAQALLEGHRGSDGLIRMGQSVRMTSAATPR